METVKEVIMRRDKIDEDEADNQIASFRDELNEMIEKIDNSFDLYEAATEAIADHFGLEPDYLDEFIF